MSIAAAHSVCMAIFHHVSVAKHPAELELSGAVLPAAAGYPAESNRLLANDRRHYRLGWNAASRAADLDAAESRYIARNGNTFWDEWMNGWLDNAAGRDFGHIPGCPTHSSGRCEN